MKNNDFDQFYTNPLISDDLVNIIERLFPEAINYELLEPSAGTGNFITSFKRINQHSKVRAYDIEPKARGIIKADYLSKKINFKRERLILGNPPFGKRGLLALEFLNKGLSEAPIVAMILPNIFNRFMIQKQINPEAKLVYTKQLEENSFIVDDKEYGVKCVFQIWTTLPAFAADLRIKTAPQIRHADFETWIHNNTEATLKYFDKEKYGWNFAVHRQGYYDFTKKITDPNELIANRQYFFVKAKNKRVLNLINRIDFEKLSKTNTQVLGFSTTDFVREYKKLKGE